MKNISISDALLVILIDSGIDLDGTNVLAQLHHAEDVVLDRNKAMLQTGNLNEFGGMTENGRRNAVHTKREESFVDACIDIAQRGPGGLFL
jgi:hypothetical protein